VHISPATGAADLDYLQKEHGRTLDKKHDKDLKKGTKDYDTTIPTTGTQTYYG